MARKNNYKTWFIHFLFIISIPYLYISLFIKRKDLKRIMFIKVWIKENHHFYINFLLKYLQV